MRIVVYALPILLFLLCCANTNGPVICTLVIGEAQQITKNLRKLVIAAMNLPRFAYRRGKYSPLCP